MGFQFLERFRRKNNVLRPETKEFLDTLHKYIDCRLKMDEKYQQVDEMLEIAKLEVSTDSGGIIQEAKEETDGDPSLDYYKPEYQQQATSGQGVKNLPELYKASEACVPVFQALIQKLVDRVRQQCGDDDDPSISTVEIQFAPLKGKDRAQAKADDDYAQRNPGPGVSWLYDIVRGSIKFSTSEQIATCLEILMDDPEFHIVKAKNRFAKPTLTGYRDLNLCLSVDCDGDDDGKYKHICEIQIHHKELKKLSIVLKSHKYYEYFRKYFAGSTETLEDCLEDLELIAGSNALDNTLLTKLLEKGDNEERLERLGDLFNEHLCENEWAANAYTRLLETRLAKRDGDENDPSIGHSYVKIGIVLRQQGKLVEAKKIFEKAKEIYQKTLGGEHESVATVLNHLGEVSRFQDNIFEAIFLYEIALTIFQSKLGEDHPSVANTLNNLAIALMYKGQHEQAMEKFQSALCIYLKAYGEEHSAVANCYNNIGRVLNLQGQLDQAMETYNKALTLMKKALGEEHTSVSTLYSNMGTVLREHGKYDEAMKMFENGLAIKEKTLGGDHASVGMSYYNMGLVLGDQTGKEKEALAKHKIALTIFQRTLDWNHSSIADVKKEIQRLEASKPKEEPAAPVFKKKSGALANT